MVERQIQCTDTPQNYGLYTFENFTGVLLKDMEDASKPADTREIDEFKNRLARVDWNHVDGELRRFETVMGRLLEQLESASGRFIGPIRLRNSLIKEIEDYNLCRNKIKGDNRDLSHRYETLNSQQHENQEKLKDLDRRKSAANQKKHEFEERRALKKNELSDKEQELKQVEDQLEDFQEGGQEKMNKMYLDMQEQAKKRMDEMKLQLEEVDETIAKLRSNRESYIEEGARLNGKIQKLLAERDQKNRKLQKLDQKIDYDADLQKLLPQKETIAHQRELERTFTERFNLHKTMLANARGLPNEAEIRATVIEMRENVRKAKKLLAGCNQTKFKYHASFERQIKVARDEISNLDSLLHDAMRARDIARNNAADLMQQLESKEALRNDLRGKLNVKENFEIPKDLQAERQYEERKNFLETKAIRLRTEIQNLDITLKDMDSGLGPARDDSDMARDFSLEASEINRKMKETEAELNRFKKILISKLDECINKKIFIQSIQRQGAEQLDDAVRYYKDIRATKQEAKGILDNLYIR